MKTKTYLAGKDAALEDTIDTATQLLSKLQLEITPVNWLNPAPHCWSVHLEAKSCSHLYTNGKGTSRLASLASAFGEFFERLSSNYFFADYFLENDGSGSPFLFYPDELWFPVDDNGAVPLRDRQGVELLSESLRSFYDPEGELEASHLVDHNSNTAGHLICSLPFRSLLTDQTIYFPVSILDNLYVSNGMAAGNSAAECCSQAMAEILERYVKSIIIGKGISLPDVPGTYLGRYPKLCAILDTLGGQRLIVRVKDASLGGKFPVICALMVDQDSGGVFAAFGASCRFETAVERTLTELLQGRAAEQLRNFQSPCHDIRLVADPHNLESHFVDSDGLLSWQMFKDRKDFAFTPWDFSGTTTEEYRQLLKIISGYNFDIFRAEYRHAGMYCCRILVPGMSEIYPVDDLIWNNRNSGSILRPHLLRLNRMDRDELGMFLDLVESRNFSDQQLVSHAIGILFDKNSPWYSLRIGELKAMIFLAIGDQAAGLEWCSWTLHSGELDPHRKRMYRLLMTLLNFSIRGEEATDYAQSLRLFYGEDEIQTADAVARGKTNFPGLNFAMSWADVSREHQNMLEIYRRLNSFKAKTVTPTATGHWW